MKVIEKFFTNNSRTDEFTIYPIGDVHIGALNCAEEFVDKLVKRIAKEKNSYWIGGGDYCDFIKPQDLRRYTPECLPDWLITGNPAQVRENLSDITEKQFERFTKMFAPIKHKCLGLISGNHEESMIKNYNSNFMYKLCTFFNVEDLTDAAFIRLMFAAKKYDKDSAANVTIFITHGHGGGRTAGSEANHLERLSSFVDANIVLRGHSHTFEIRPPQIRLYIPQRKVVNSLVCLEKETRVANWGSFMLSYKEGPATYDSRKQYKPRPLKALAFKIKPRHSCRDKADWTIRRDISLITPIEIDLHSED